MNQYHIHFGAGKLGLGLVLPVLKSVQVPIAIFQRPGSSDWVKLADSEDVQFYINNEHLFTVKYITDNFKGNIAQLISQGEHLLVSTKNIEILKAIMKATQSFSTSVGPEGLSEVLDCFKLGATFPEHTKIYAFENDFTAVEKFGEQLKRTIKNIEVVKVMSDRICTAREITRNRVKVVCEDYKGNAVVFSSNCDNCCPFTTPKSSRRGCLSKNVVLARSMEEEVFYYNRKFSLLNGIHYTMAVYSYDVLLEDKIAKSKWADQPLSSWTKNPQHIKDLKLMVEARILQLMSQTDKATLYEIYNTKDMNKIFSHLKGFSTEVLARIDKSKDTTGRILPLGNSSRFTAKYQQHFCGLNEFFASQSTIPFKVDVSEQNIQEYRRALSRLKQMIHSISPVPL